MGSSGLKLLMGSLILAAHAATELHANTPPILVTQIETTITGSGTAMADGWIGNWPDEPLPDYSDSLNISTPTNSDARTLDALISMTAGTNFECTVTYVDPDTEMPAQIFPWMEIELHVLEHTTVHITCTGADGPAWVISGETDTDIDAPYDADLELCAGIYTLEPTFNWSSTTPHALSIEAIEPGTLALGDFGLSVEMHSTVMIDERENLSSPGGIPSGSSISTTGTLPACYGSYQLDSTVGYLDDETGIIPGTNFIAMGDADYLKDGSCANARATFNALFTLSEPHYAVWSAYYEYYEDAPFLGGLELCHEVGGYGCTYLETGSWQLLDGGIYDGSDVDLELTLVCATIRVPEDAPTIAQAITIARNRAASIQVLGPFCSPQVDLAFTVAVDTGTYAGTIDVTGPGVTLTIEAVDGPGTVEIRGENLDRCIDMASGYTDVVFDGIAFLEGTATHGGAILVENDTNIVFQDCSFTNNNATDHGGAIAIQGNGTCSFTSCTFDGNSAGTTGGAISLHPVAATMTILDTCILQGNTASIAGGGIEHVNTTGSTLDVVNSTICTNVPEDITGPWTDLGSNTVCLSCVGDIVPDGIINGEDLSVLLGDWGKCPPKATCAGDLNDDSVVNGADLSILLANWGPCN